MAGEYRDLVHEHVGVSSGLRVRELRAALEYLAGMIAGPVTDPIPALTPDAWREMRCRDGATVPESDVELLTDHRVCRCSWCRWQARWGPVVADWQRSQHVRPHRHYAHPYGSVAAALEDLARHREDGTVTRSWAGPMVDRGASVRQLGASVQTTHRRGDPPEVRRVDLALDVERCVSLVASRDAVRGAVSTGAAVVVLLASATVGVDADVWAERWEVSPSVVRGVLRRGRRGLTVELAARGLVPEPRSKARLGSEIEARRVELEGVE